MQSLNPEPVGVSSTVPTYHGEMLDTRQLQKKWTAEEYYRLGDLGFFEGKRVQLIRGEIIEMSPMGSPHATGITILADLLRHAFGSGFFVRVQAPLDVDQDSQPEPDVAVVSGDPRDFVSAHPKTVVLAAEVSDSTLSLDRNVKSTLYAQSSIPEYWVLNLRGRCVEVFRRPLEDPALGFMYAERIVFGENETISRLAKPKSKIKVADILP